MLASQKKFKEITQDIYKVIPVKKRKFNNNLLIIIDKNVVLLNFQKSQESNANMIIFTINFGICIEKIYRQQSERDLLIDRIKIEDCQWRQRIFDNEQPKRDIWWKIENGLLLENINIINGLVLENLNNACSIAKDEDFRCYLLSGGAVYPSEKFRQEYIEILNH